MEFISRIEIAKMICRKIESEATALQQQFSASKDKIGYCYLDDLLPEEFARQLYAVFPKREEMVHKKSLREDKYVAAQMNQYHPLLEETIYAFQDKNVVKLIGKICGIEQAIPDEHLYAGGLSGMAHKQFLNPHLDNSHDKDRQRWRVLNLLYYVTPDWEPDYGGNLELWPEGLKEKQVTIHSKFNRLAIMATHNQSLHSVSPVVYDGFRCCISNYYFSNTPLLETDTFHVTSFRGRPENVFNDFILQCDTFLRMGIRKIFKKGIKENPHVYKKED